MGFNNLLVATLPLVPRSLMGLFAKRYVAGETVEQALSAAGSMNGRGALATLDILGEHVESEEDAAAVTHAYVHLYSQIAEEGVTANISIKPTHIGLSLGDEVCRDNLKQIVAAARKHNNFLRIDMENSPYTDATLDLYREFHGKYSKIGPVLQAYLHRSANDLAAIMSDALNFRLCKGIYRESPEIAIQGRRPINDNFLALLRQALRGPAYAGIATHDLGLIDDCLTVIRQLEIPHDRYEFQVLYGVPMKGKLEELIRAGHTVRVYIPFGGAWYDYSRRRLKENPNIAGYVINNLFRR